SRGSARLGCPRFGEPLRAPSRAGRRALASPDPGCRAGRGALRTRPASPPGGLRRRRRPALPGGPPPAARQLDLQAAGLVVRGQAAAPERRLRGRLGRRRREDRPRELLPGERLVAKIAARLSPPLPLWLNRGCRTDTGRWIRGA